MTATILAIDTTTDICSAALSLKGQIYSRKIAVPREHAQKLLSLVDALFNETELTVNDLDAIAFGCGPGSFTGLRIASAITQGLAFAANVPVIPVSTLRAIAFLCSQQFEADKVMAALDARQHEVYWGCFEKDTKSLMKLSGEESVVAPSAVTLPKKVEDWAGAGPGWNAYLGPLTERTQDKQKAIFEDIMPEAEAILQLALKDFEAGLHVPAEQALPTYIRNKVVQV